MKLLGLNVHASAACLATIGIAGCAGTQRPLGASGLAPVANPLSSRNFQYTGKEQSFTVPAGVTQVTIRAAGASGGGYSSGSYGISGNGGRVRGTISVTPGETLAVFVGGQGGTASHEQGGSGGFNGGGAAGGGGGQYAWGGDGGGGASDVRQGGDGLSKRIIVAAGGGGGGVPQTYYGGGPGGIGGGLIGGNGEGDGFCVGHGGRGGTQDRGGNGGKAGRNGGHYGHGTRGLRGKFGIGGGGGSGVVGGGGGGGGAGGGWYGGGGGGAGSLATSGVCGGGGGAGGSSFVESTATQVKDVAGGADPGNGFIVISWQAPYPTNAVSVPARMARSGSARYSKIGDAEFIGVTLSLKGK